MNLNFNLDLRTGLIIAVLLILAAAGLVLRNTMKAAKTMEEMFLPERVLEKKIKKDFSTFDGEELREQTERALRTVFQAITTQDSSELSKCFPTLKEQVQAQIELREVQNAQEVFDEIYMERPQIVEYQNETKPFSVSLKIFVQTLHYVKKGEEILEGSPEKPERAEYLLKLSCSKGDDSRNWQFEHYDIDFVWKSREKQNNAT